MILSCVDYIFSSHHIVSPHHVLTSAHSCLEIQMEQIKCRGQEWIVSRRERNANKKISKSATMTEQRPVWSLNPHCVVEPVLVICSYTCFEHQTRYFFQNKRFFVAQPNTAVPQNTHFRQFIPSYVSFVSYIFMLTAEVSNIRMLTHTHAHHTRARKSELIKNRPAKVVCE